MSTRHSQLLVILSTIFTSTRDPNLTPNHILPVLHVEVLGGVQQLHLRDEHVRGEHEVGVGLDLLDKLVDEEALLVFRFGGPDGKKIRWLGTFFNGCFYTVLSDGKKIGYTGFFYYGCCIWVSFFIFFYIDTDRHSGRSDNTLFICLLKMRSLWKINYKSTMVKE